MKKAITLFMLGTFLLSVTVVSKAQNTQVAKSTGKSGTMIAPSRAGELDCPANSIFSQAPVNSDNGYFSDNETASFNQRIFDNFAGVTSPINGITFWGILFDVGNSGDCYGGGPVDFTIDFYQDNAGSVGTFVQTFNVTITPTVTGSIVSNCSLLKFETTLSPSVSLANGWVCVYRLNPGDYNCIFAWAKTYNGDDWTGFNNFGGQIYYQGSDEAFCLAGEQPPPVPISNWALFLAIGLILVFAIIRFKNNVV